MSEALLEHWQAAWPKALDHWSKYTRLRNPLICVSSVSAAREGLSGSFAMIRLNDNSVVIDLEMIMRVGLQDYAVEILAHEIGHHILAPASAVDHFRLLARIRAGLPTLENHAPMLANLYTDLLINDRLQRHADLRMDEIYYQMKIYGERKQEAETPPPNKLWTLYMGIYERLWQLEKGSLGGPVDHVLEEGNAWLGSRLVRVYADDWLTGGGRFAALALPYLVEDLEQNRQMENLLADIKHAAQGCEPVGIIAIEDGEAQAIHPSDDPLVTGDVGADASGRIDEASLKPETDKAVKGQLREPFEYGEILKAAGVDLSEEQVAARYYRELALPHLIKYPIRLSEASVEPQLEGLDAWEIGEALDDIDWLASVTQSPIPIPDATMVKRHMGLEPGTDRARTPLDLDIYVDSSGSMPNPRQHISYLTLAGAIIALSALKAGAKVQATLWSGPRECLSTNGFISNETEILAVLTGFFGGSTAFPIHHLRDTYAARKPYAPDAHILMISDDGISTMFDSDERGNSGWDVARQALDIAKGGGTMALNLWAAVEQLPWSKKAIHEQGWDIHKVNDFAQLVDFSRAFARRKYGETS